MKIRQSHGHLIYIIDLFRKSQNAPVLYPTMFHWEQKCSHFCSEWSIVGYWTSAFWDLWIRSMGIPILGKIVFKLKHALVWYRNGCDGGKRLCCTIPGLCFIINIVFPGMGITIVKIRWSYLYDGNPHPGKIATLYWIILLVLEIPLCR